MAKLDSGAMTIGNNDNWREIFDDQNATAVAANQATADLAPIINGKRCALSVASGGFVLLRNSTITGKADGAYTAAKAIPANTDLDGSYLTAISGGVANALNGNIASIRKLKYMDLTDTTPMNVQSRSSGTISYNNFVGCSCKTNGVMALPYLNSSIVYIKFVNYSDMSTYSGSVDMRVWYV